MKISTARNLTGYNLNFQPKENEADFKNYAFETEGNDGRKF